MRRSSRKIHLSPSFMTFRPPRAAGTALRKERPGSGSAMELLMTRGRRHRDGAGWLHAGPSLRHT